MSSSNLVLCPYQMRSGKCTNPHCGKGLHLWPQYVSAVQAESSTKNSRTICFFHYDSLCRSGGQCTFVHVAKSMIEQRKSAHKSSCCGTIKTTLKLSLYLVIAVLVFLAILILWARMESGY